MAHSVRVSCSASPSEVAFSCRSNSASGSVPAAPGCSGRPLYPSVKSRSWSILVSAAGRPVSGPREFPCAKTFSSSWSPRASLITSRTPHGSKWIAGVDVEALSSSGRAICPRTKGALGFRRRGTCPIEAMGLQGGESEPGMEVFTEKGGEDSHLWNGVDVRDGLCYGCPCGRRRLIASLGGLTALSQLRLEESASALEPPDYDAVRISVHPDRATWYEEIYALALAKGMQAYESEIAGYKRKLFASLSEDVENVLEIGVGTGPNLKYYGDLPKLQSVVGVDPNLQMVKYCKESANLAGLSNGRFEFKHAVGEGIPVGDASVDAVICTLTLCSVSDVSRTLQEVNRVLKPGGAFFFVEHVAAEDGTALRFWQGIFNPLQQWVADGCHLTRNTLQQIQAAQFGSIQSETLSVKSVSLFSPHVMGVAYK